MGTSKQTIQINAEIKASLSGMDKVVSDLEEGLKKQKYDLSKNSGLAKLIKQYKNAKSEFDSLTELDKIGLGDVDKTTKAAQKVANIYKQLGQSFRKIQAGNIDTFKNLFPDNFSAKIEKGNKAIDQYFKKLEEKSTKESRAQILQRDLERLNTTLSTLENKRIKAEVEVDISKAKEKLKKLQEERKNFLEDFSKSITPKEVKDSSGKIYDKANIQAQIEAAEKEVKDKEKKVKNLEKRKLSQQELDEIDQLKEGYEGVDFKRQQKAAQDALKKYRDEASARDLAQNEGIVDKGRSRRTFGNLTDEELEDRIREKQQELIKLEKKEKQYKDKIAEIRARPEQEFKQQKKQADAEVSTAKTKLENANKELETYQKLKAAQEEVIKQKTADFESGKDNTGVRQEDIDKLKQYDDAIQEVTRSIKELNEEKTYSNQAEKDDATSKKKSEIDKKKLELQTLQNSIKELTKATNIDEVFKKLEELNLPLKDIERSSEGLQKLKKELKELDNNTVEGIRQSLKQLGFTAEETEDIIKQLDNGLDKLDLEKVNITKTNQDIENLKNQVLDFFSITNTIQIFKNAIRDAFDTVKELDAAMTETAVVTDFSVEDMWEKLPEYSEEATKLGASIKSLYEATTLYYQQGLNSEQAMSVGIETMKMARIANMDAAAATEAMTAALRGFNMEINETSATRINDVYSELAAITAADTSQIATAMSKTASIAESANMEFETTAALLAQIIETTQEAPETAGTALKTIIARFTEVKKLFSEGMLTGEDSEGEEININKIDAALKTVGISLKDFLTGSKGIDDIFLELASKWDTLDLATQRYIATTAAGSRQQSRFLAMMGNYDRTMELVNAATNSAGASQKQFGKTLESMEAKLQKLKNAWDTFTMGLANNELIKFGVDLLTKLLETVNDLTDDLGGAVGGFAKLAIAIGGLKIGKKVFDSFFDVKPLEGVAGKFKGISNMVGKALTDMGVKVKNGVYENIEATNAIVNKLTTGITMVGIACGTFAQYLRAIGLEDFATGLEKVSGVLIAVGSGLNMVNSLAASMGTTLAGLGKGIIAALGPVLPYIIAIGVALYSVYTVLKKIYDNSPNGQLKKIQKSTESAAQEANNATEAYNNLKNAIDGIESKTSTLDELTRGTQEWREAVVALNGEVLKLVDTYPELAGFIENEGGVLKIDYEKTQRVNGEEQTATDILNSYLNKQTVTQQDYNQRQIREKEAEIDSEYAKVVNKLTGFMYEGNKENWTKEWGEDWNKTQKVMNDLAIAIAKGEVQTDEESLIGWLWDKETYMYDYADFDYSAFEQYGQYLISQQEAINGLTDATIAAQIAMADFGDSSYEAIEATSNFDTDILRESYEKIKADNYETTPALISQYVEEMGYFRKEIPTLGDNIVKYYTDEEKTQEVTFTDQDVKDHFVNKETNKDFEAMLQNLANHFDSASDKQRDMFNEIFAEGVQELSLSTLQQYGEFKDGQFSLSEKSDKRDNLAKSMGFEDFSALATALELGVDELAAQLNQVFTEGGAEFIKVRKNLVKNMTKYSTGAQKDFDVNTNLLSLLEAKYKDLDVAGILTDVISKLELTGDEEFSTAAYESLRDIMMKTEGAAEMQDALNFFNEIDFNNPIDALDTINNEIKSGTGYSKELAIAMKDANGSFLSVSSQMSTLFQSADFEDIKEDLDDIIEKNGEISAADVFDLTKSYKSLDKVLKNNEITANGLAEILEQISEGTLKVDELTETVLAAMSSFESLDSIAAKSVKFFEDFDLGIDENTIGETIIEWGDLISENMKVGAVGNSQNFRILDTLFPGWDEDIETAEGRIAEMTRLGKLLKGNGQNLRKMWSDIHAGKDYKGNDISLSAENQKMGLSVRDTGKEIIFEGWEGKDLTSVDLVSWISDAYEVSTEMAEAMLTDFKNYSGDLAAELRDNDYAAGIEKAYETLKQFGDVKLVDEREIETIANLLGTSADKVKADLDAYANTQGTEITYSQFYTDEGKIKSFEEIQTFMGNLSASGAQAGKKWSDEFITTSSTGIEQLDVSKLEKQLGEIGITGINAEGLKQQAFEAIQSGLKAGVEEGKAEIIHTLANGEQITVDITANTTYEEYQQQVVAKTQQAENAAMAEAFKSVFENIEVTPSISENTVIEFRSKIEEAANQAQPKVNVTLSEESTTNIQNQLTDATDDPKEVPANIRVKSSNIGDYLWKRTVYVDIVVDKNEIPEATNTTGGIPGRAKGIKNAPHAETSLVSEEGPELIQKADGSAYLSGTSGPEIVNIEKGDTVYTAEETENIFKKRNHNEFPRYASGYGNGTAYWGTGSGGKGSGDSDDEDWENPFDKLYNLVREIDEELRRRERLERRYEKLLESVDLTAGKLFDNAVEQLKQLEKEKLLNEELRDARRSQIQQYQQENADLMKYAKVVQNERGEDVLRIHWDQINLVEDPEQGQRIEDYVSQLEEWFDSLEDAEDKLNDIEDRIEEVKELGKEEYLDLENAIKDAITAAYQEEINKLSEINESINDTNTQLIDAISKQVNRIRQQRENEKTERELEEKQRQLLYLSQDTSGANDMAILELQREIEEGTVDYTDTLIDQKIDELQTQNDEAAQQREQQIQLLQSQLDHLIQSGEIWDEVYGLMDEGLDPEAGLIRGSKLEQILKNAENFNGMSKVQQMDWLKELQQQAAQAVVYMRLTTEKIDTAVELNRQNYFGSTTPEPEYNGSSSSSGGGGSSGGSGGSSGGSSGSSGNSGYSDSTVRKAQAFVGTAVDGIWGPNSAAAAAAMGYNSLAAVVKAMNGSNSSNTTTGSGSWESENSAYWDSQKGSSSNSSSNSGNSNNSNKTPKQVVIYYSTAKKTVTYDYNSDWQNLRKTWEKQWGPSSIVEYKYKQGGLADFTGPAWLDGTKSRPELVLNQRDTQNFIQLKDILASLMTGSHISTENNGDITYDIDINVESIGSDYDVEQVANKVKSLINEDARYRNNNAVSLKR